MSGIHPTFQDASNVGGTAGFIEISDDDAGEATSWTIIWDAG
jgi:hypothetical protein